MTACNMCAKDCPLKLLARKPSRLSFWMFAVLVAGAIALQRGHADLRGRTVAERIAVAVAVMVVN